MLQDPRDDADPKYESESARIRSKKRGGMED